MSEPSLGMSTKEARLWRSAILSLCFLSLFFIFQPFSLGLFTVGCVGVVLGGLIFNVMPYCTQGTTRRTLFKSMFFIGIIFIIFIAIASGAAQLYIAYLTWSR